MVSSSGRICDSCFTRMTKSQAGSNFFQPVLYIACRRRWLTVLCAVAAFMMLPQR
jgi:hypothetical protein